jgi:hypothetical protein
MNLYDLISPLGESGFSTEMLNLSCDGTPTRVAFGGASGTVKEKVRV